MPALVHLKLDFSDDPSILRSTKQIPEFVRKTKIASAAKRKKLAASNYALVMVFPDGQSRKLFSTRTPGDTWLSVKAFEKNAHKLPLDLQEVAAVYLDKADKEWRTKAATDERLAKLAAQASERVRSNMVQVPFTLPDETVPGESIKTASARFASSLDKLTPDWFAIVTPDGHKFYPLHTPELVKQAASWFDEHARELKPSWRKMYTDRLIHAASRHGLVVESSQVTKYAGASYSPDLPVAIELRRSVTLDSQGLKLLADLWEKKSELSPDRFAAALELVDKKLGLDKYWDGHVPDPYASVFGQPKIADYSYKSRDGEVTGSALREFCKSKDYRDRLEAYLDKAVIDELERNPIEVFDSLPKPEKRIIIDLMKEK